MIFLDGVVKTYLQMPQSWQWKCSLSTCRTRTCISSTTKSKITRSSRSKASSIGISRRRRRICTRCRSTRPCKRRSCSTLAQPAQKKKSPVRNKIWSKKQKGKPSGFNTNRLFGVTDETDNLKSRYPKISFFSFFQIKKQDRIDVI